MIDTGLNLGSNLGPRITERGGEAAWTLVGPLDTTSPARVDGAGLVTPHGADWSFDWWIGADDRWYFPSREAAVRQQRHGPGPVLATSVRIPSGDAHHRVYGAVVDGREVTVIEVENDSPVPVALAIALRPYTVDGDGSIGSAGSMGSPRSGENDGGATAWPLRLAGPVVTIDGVAALRLPRTPNQAAVRHGTDLVDVVVAGEELEWVGGVTTTATNAVFLYPLPHRTTLRFVIPAPGNPGSVAVNMGSVPDPASVPDYESVARGWSSIVDGGTRFEFPDSGLTRLVGAARARLLLGAGPSLIDAIIGLRPGAGAVMQALTFGRHRGELVSILTALADTFPTELPHGPGPAAEVVSAIGPALGVVDAAPEVQLVEVVAQLTHLVDRAKDPTASHTARLGLAAVARAAGDVKGARHLEKKANGHRKSKAASTDESDSAALDEVMAQAAAASEAGSWSTDSAERAAQFVAAARSLLFEERNDELLLLPGFPTAWRGGNVEVHRAPTRHGELSFGIRWHGARPALLWQLDGSGVTLRCPGLDPDWQTNEPRGETLLAGAAEGLASLPGPGDGFR